MSESETITTGQAIPVQDEEVATQNKQIVLNLADTGGINVDFNGDFKTYEVFGALLVTLLDLGVQNFINPNLSAIMASGRQSEANILESLKGLGEALSKDTSGTNPLIEAIAKAVSEHSG